MMAANGKAKTCADIDRDGSFGVRVRVTERHRGVRRGGPQRRRQRSLERVGYGRAAGGLCCSFAGKFAFASLIVHRYSDNGIRRMSFLGFAKCKCNRSSVDGHIEFDMQHQPRGRKMCKRCDFKTIRIACLLYQYRNRGAVPSWVTAASVRQCFRSRRHTPPVTGAWAWVTAAYR